jgi:general secretion pathway protein F
MPNYRYTILDTKGRQRSGRIEAYDLETAKRAVTANGDVLVDLSVSTRRDWFRYESNSDLSLPNAASFATELAGLLKAGAPLRKALAITADGKSAAASVAAACLKSLDEGYSLSYGLRQFKGGGHVLSEFARAGEAGAGLGALLDSGGRFLAARVEAVARIRKAFAYPIFICVLAIVALIVITFYVAPSLAPILEDAGQTGLITWLASIGVWGQANYQSILLALICSALALVLVMQRPSAKLVLNTVLWRLPWLGAAAKDLDTGQSCDVMAALLERDRPLETSLQFAASVSGPKLAEAYRSIAEKLRDGTVASEAFASETDLPQDVRRLIILGERSSAFAHAIKQAGALCHARALRRIDQMAAILGPTLVVGLGVLISLLMLSVLNSLGSLGDVS